MSPWLPIELIIFGTALVWLSALFPALVVTLAKGQWRLFGWGLLTAGITWFAGALLLAPPTIGLGREVL
jgi:hypothetical protein